MNYFTPESQTVKNYLLLIRAGKTTIEKVPDISNLREVVQSVLDSEKLPDEENE